MLQICEEASFTYGHIDHLSTLVLLVNAFGGRPGFEQAVRELQDALLRGSGPIIAAGLSRNHAPRYYRP